MKQLGLLLDEICNYNSSDMPDSAKLYEGTALLVTLPSADIVIPSQDRINPVFFSGSARGLA